MLSKLGGIFIGKSYPVLSTIAVSSAYHVKFSGLTHTIWVCESMHSSTLNLNVQDNIRLTKIL